MADKSKFKPFFTYEKEEDGFKCRFEMQMGVHLGKAYDFAHEVLTQILIMSQEAAEKAKREEDKKIKEEKKEETSKA